MAFEENQRFQKLFEQKNAAPPVTAWKHFIDKETDAHSLAQATIAFQKKYQWDIVKINPRATYYAEAFGNRYDFSHYTDVLPLLLDYPIKSSRDLPAFAAHAAVDFRPFEEQIEAAKEIRKGVGKNVPVLQTLFSPLCILTFLSGHNPYPGADKGSQRSASRLNTLIAEDPAAVLEALRTITDVLLEYIDLILKADIDGFFYSIFGHGNLDELSAEDYTVFSEPFDRELTAKIKNTGGIVMLHTCGPHSHPERFALFETVDIVHWADRDAGNPSLAKTQTEKFLNSKIAAGGVSQWLFAENSTEKIAEQADETIRQAKRNAFILTGGCGLPLKTTEKALWTLRNSTLKSSDF